MPIAGETDGPIWLNFLSTPMGGRVVLYAKNFEFFF